MLYDLHDDGDAHRAVELINISKSHVCFNDFYIFFIFVAFFMFLNVYYYYLNVFLKRGLQVSRLQRLLFYVFSKTLLSDVCYNTNLETLPCVALSPTEAMVCRLAQIIH